MLRDVTNPQGSQPRRCRGPAYWRSRAAEARARAGQMVNIEAREQMLDVAYGYERLAEREEQGAQARIQIERL